MNKELSKKTTISRKNALYTLSKVCWVQTLTNRTQCSESIYLLRSSIKFMGIWHTFFCFRPRITTTRASIIFAGMNTWLGNITPGKCLSPTSTPPEPSVNDWSVEGEWEKSFSLLTRLVPIGYHNPIGAQSA